MTLDRRLVAEWLGAFCLLATVVGFGIMAKRPADDIVAVTLLGNTIPAAAILVVLITMFGSILGVHFNPAVTLSLALRHKFTPEQATLCVVARPQVVSMAVGLCFIAAYWFTSPNSFASPSVSIAPGFSDSFARISPTDITAFVGVQLVAAVLATLFFRWVLEDVSDG